MDVLYFGLSFLPRRLFPWEHISQQATSSRWISSVLRYILSFYFLRLFYFGVAVFLAERIASMEYKASHPLHARRHPKPHSSKAPSESSDHDFIYNATKADPEPGIHFNREEDNANRQSHLFPGGRELDERLAMLLASLPEMVPTADHPEERMRARLDEGRPKTLSDNWVVSKTNDSLGSVFKDAKSKIGDLRRWGRGRVISFSEADSGTKRPRWVINLISPVQPFLPKYPPPERSPTPPGLPTFGTPEAINYTTQFDVRSSLPNRNDPIRQSSTSRALSRRATESYSHMLRRILGLPSSSSSSTVPPTSQTNRRHGYAVARAEDGTAVLGRFPYRTSGHGTNLNRNLEYHPFHQDPSGVASLDDRHRSRRQSRSGHQNTTTRARNSIQHATRFSRSRFSALPSVPEPAVSPAPAPAPGPRPRSSAYVPEPNSPTMLTYDGEGNGAYTSTSRTSPQSSPTGTEHHNLTKYLWDGYAVLIQYMSCCCIIPTDDPVSNNVDTPDSGDAIPSTSLDGSVSGDYSRNSDETFVTALDWYEPSTGYRFSGLNRGESVRSMAFQSGVMERR